MMTPERETQIRDVAGAYPRSMLSDTLCELDSLRAALAARDAELTRLREGIQDAIYDCGNCRGNYPGNCPACQPLAALLPPTPTDRRKESDRERETPAAPDERG